MVELPMTVSTTVPFPTDAVSEVLAHRHRRSPLRHLVDSGGTVTVEQRVGARPADQHARTDSDDGHTRHHRLNDPEMRPVRLVNYGEYDSPPSVAGNDLAQARPERCL